MLFIAVKGTLPHCVQMGENFSPLYFSDKQETMFCFDWKFIECTTLTFKNQNVNTQRRMALESCRGVKNLYLN